MKVFIRQKDITRNLVISLNSLNKYKLLLVNKTYLTMWILTETENNTFWEQEILYLAFRSYLPVIFWHHSN